MTVEDIELARLEDLRVADALGELAPDERAELVRLSKAYPGVEALPIERSIAALLAAAAPADRDLPDALRARVVASADKYFGHERSRDLEPVPFVPRAVLEDRARARTRASDLHPVSSSWRTWGGWAAAAALGALSLGLWWNRPDTNASLPVTAGSQQDNVTLTPTPAEPGPVPRSAVDGAATVSTDDPTDADSAQQLANARFSLRRAWTPGNDPSGQRVTGDVIWDGDTQRGYMRFTNLPKNNRSVEQYQLWIFDASRDERYPVDGGVFDVVADGSGRVVVPIRARLKVRTPTMFAVTIERPGGVVVSDRSRIVALAKV